MPNVLDIEQIPVVDQFGNIAKIDPSQLPEYQQKYGAKVVPEEEWQKHIEKKEFGNKEGQAFGLGLLRGGSFGISDAIIRGLGGMKAADYVRKVEEYNPISSNVSNVLGAVIPAVASGFTSVPEQGAEALAARLGEGALGALDQSALHKGLAYAPTNLAGKLGHAVAHGLVEHPETGEAAGSFLSRLAPQALGMGAEAAPYGAAHALSEDMLGDPNLNASKLISHMGMDAVLTGAFGVPLGAAFGAGEEYIPKAFAKATSSIDSISNWLKGFPQSGAETALDRSALPAEEKAFIKPYYENPELRKKAMMSDFTREQGKAELTDNMQTLVDQYHDIKDEVNQYRSGFNKYTISGTYAERASSGASDVLAQSKQWLKGSMGNPEFEQSTVRQVSKLVDNLESQLSEVKTPYGYPKATPNTGGEMYEAVRKYQQDIGNIAYQKGLNNKIDQNTANSLRSVHSYNKEFLNNDAEIGPAAAFNKKITGALDRNFTEGMEKEFNKNVGTITRDPQTGWVTDVTVDPGKMSTLAESTLKGKGIRKVESINNFVNFAKEMLGIREEMEGLYPKGNFNVDAARQKLLQTSDIIGNNLEDLSHKKALQMIKSIQMPEVGTSAGAMLQKGLGKIPLIGGALEKIPLGPTTPAGHIQRLYAMDRSLNGVDGKIHGIVDRFLTGKGLSKLEEVARAAAAPITVASTEGGDILGHGAIHSFLDSLSGNEENLPKITDAVGSLVNNPNQLQDQLAKNLEKMYAVAPNTASAIAAKAVMGLKMAYDAAPKDKRGSLERLLSQEVYKPSSLEKHGFKNTLEAINNPMKPFMDMALGRQTKEGMAVMGRLHPELLNHQQMKLTNHIADQGIKLNYKQRMNMGNYFGLPTDQSLSTGFYQSYGAMHSGIKSPQMQPPHKPRTPAIGKITMSNRSLTSNQKLLSR